MSDDGKKVKTASEESTYGTSGIKFKHVTGVHKCTHT